MNLTEFLQPLAPETEAVTPSPRYKDADGNPLQFKIRMLNAEEDERIRRRALLKGPDGTYQLDAEKYAAALAAEATVVPDLKSAALQDAYGVMGAEELLKRLFNPGEYAAYLLEVSRFNGYGATFKELTDAAKK